MLNSMRLGTPFEKERILLELAAWKPGTGASVDVSHSLIHCSRWTYMSTQCHRASLSWSIVVKLQNGSNQARSASSR